MKSSRLAGFGHFLSEGEYFDKIAKVWESSFLYENFDTYYIKC